MYLLVFVIMKLVSKEEKDTNNYIKNNLYHY